MDAVTVIAGQHLTKKKYDENAHEGVATELIAQVPHVNHVRRHYPNKPTNKKKWFTNVHLPF